MIEYVDHLHEHFVDPVVDPRRPLPCCRRGPATARRCAPTSLARRVWRRVSRTRRPAWRVRRFGQVIRVRPEAIDEYERLHAEPWPGVLAAIRRANIRNYSIYRHGELLFAYFEYVGDDFAADMAAMAADPDRPAVVDADRRDAGPLPGPRAGTGGSTSPRSSTPTERPQPPAIAGRRTRVSRVADGRVERLEVADVGVVEERVDEAVQVAVRRQELRLETRVERRRDR